MSEELLTIHETRKELRIGNTLCYAYINSGKLKAVKIGRSTRVLRSSINELIASLPAYKSENKGEQS